MWQVVRFMSCQTLHGPRIHRRRPGIDRDEWPPGRKFWGRYYTAVFHMGLFESGRLIGIIAVIARWRRG